MNTLVKSPGLMTLVHDTSNSISLIGSSVSIIRRELKDLGVNNDLINLYLENITHSLRKFKGAIDEYYTKLKTINDGK